MLRSPAADHQHRSQEESLVRCYVKQPPTGMLPVMAARTSDREALRLSADELRAWRGFLTVHARLIRDLDTELMRREGLSLRAYDVLLQIAQAPGRRLRMQELAEAVLLSPSGLTRLVDRLVREGLVERVRADDDARGACAALTASGRASVRKLTRTHLAGVRERFLTHLDAEELQTLGDVFARIIERRAPDTERTG